MILIQERLIICFPGKYQCIKKNEKADFVINTDQDMQQVEKQVVNIIKTVRKSNG